jgi:hypothetical protein
MRRRWGRPRLGRFRSPLHQPDLARALGHLPLFPEGLCDLPQSELRALVNSLQLQTAFQPADAVLDKEVTLLADEPPDPDNRVSEVWSVPPAGIRRKGRKSSVAFVHVEATYNLEAQARDPNGGGNTARRGG